MWAVVILALVRPLSVVHRKTFTFKYFSLNSVSDNLWLWPVIARHFSNRLWIFQEDNATSHVSVRANLWKEENFINTLPWPAQSLDLNIIESVLTLPVIVYNELTTPSNNLIVVFYLKRLIKHNIRTFNIPANGQISYRLLKFKGLKFTFLFTFIEGWSLDVIFMVCFCLVMWNSTSLSRKLHFCIDWIYIHVFHREDDIKV